MLGGINTARGDVVLGDLIFINVQSCRRRQKLVVYPWSLTQHLLCLGLRCSNYGVFRYDDGLLRNTCAAQYITSWWSFLSLMLNDGGTSTLVLYLKRAIFNPITIVNESLLRLARDHKTGLRLLWTVPFLNHSMIVDLSLAIKRLSFPRRISYNSWPLPYATLNVIYIKFGFELIHHCRLPFAHLLWGWVGNLVGWDIVWVNAQDWVHWNTCQPRLVLTGFCHS